MNPFAIVRKTLTWSYRIVQALGLLFILTVLGVIGYDLWGWWGVPLLPVGIAVAFVGVCVICILIQDGFSRLSQYWAAKEQQYRNPQ